MFIHYFVLVYIEKQLHTEIYLLYRYDMYILYTQILFFKQLFTLFLKSRDLA